MSTKPTPYGVAVANENGGTDYYVALTDSEDEAKLLLVSMGIQPEDVTVVNFNDMLHEQYGDLAVLSTDPCN